MKSDPPEAGVSSAPVDPESPAGAARPLEPRPHTRARGTAAERLAATWLEDHGYTIVATNVVTGAGEIDLVARDGDVLCFVEVKARESDLCGLAIEAVDRRKQRRVARAASLYLTLAPHTGPCRFDVLGMDRTGEGEPWRFTLIRDAFEVE